MGIIIILFALVYLSYYNVVENSIQSYLVDAAAKKEMGKSVEDFIQPIFGFDNFGFIPVTIAVVLLELFGRLRIPDNRVINYMGSATFMVYLIHDNDFWRCIWRERKWIKTLSEDWLLYCLKLCKWTVFVFAVGVLCYQLYLGLGRLCVRYKWMILKKNGEPVPDEIKNL